MRDRHSDQDLDHSPVPGGRATAGTPGRRTLPLGRLSPDGQVSTRVAGARAQIEDARDVHLPALHASITSRSMKEARHAATALRRSLDTAETELRGVGEREEVVTVRAALDAVRRQAEPVLALAPPPAPEVPMIDGWIPQWTGGLPDGDAAQEAENEQTWRAKLGRVIPFPHRDRIAGALGSLPGKAVHDPEGCAREGNVAFTKDDVAHFASAEPDLHVAAHEAAHLLQHAGATNDAGLGAEGHADAIATGIDEGDDVTDLVGDAGAGVTERQHGYWSSTTRMVDAFNSVTPEKTRAKKERAYKPKGNLAVKLGDTHYRFWGFDVDSAEVRREFRKLLAEISERWIADHGATFYITGHTSASGSEKHNAGLGLARAEEIQQQLRELALLRQPMVCHSGGEKIPLVDESKGPSAMARNRRVEINVIPGPPTKADKTPVPHYVDGWHDPDRCEPMDPRATAPYCIPKTSGEPQQAPAPLPGVEIGCTNLDVAIIDAEILIWSDPKNFTMVEPDVVGLPYYVPTRMGWLYACGSSGVPDQKRDELFESNAINVPATDAEAPQRRLSSLYDHRRALEAEGCGAIGPRTSGKQPTDRPFWYDPDEPWKEGPMPGDYDAERRRQY